MCKEEAQESVARQRQGTLEAGRQTGWQAGIFRTSFETAWACSSWRCAKTEHTFCPAAHAALQPRLTLILPHLKRGPCVAHMPLAATVSATTARPGPTAAAGGSTPHASAAASIGTATCRRRSSARRACQALATMHTAAPQKGSADSSAALTSRARLPLGAAACRGLGAGARATSSSSSASSSSDSSCP